MNYQDIKVGRRYIALVESKGQRQSVTVRVDKLIDDDENSVYYAMNLKSKRQVLLSPDAFLSALDGDSALNDTPPPKSGTLAETLSQNSVSLVHPHHLVVIARAGSGKTATLFGGLHTILGLPFHLVPSPQQAAVWEDMALSRGIAKSICFVAFGRDIARVLKSKVGSLGYDASTIHSLALKSLTRKFGHLEIVGDRVEEIIAELLHLDIWHLKRHQPGLVKALKETVSFCKVNLVGIDLLQDTSPEAANYGYIQWESEILKIIDRYEIEVDNYEDKILSIVPQILRRCLDFQEVNKIDNDDMIWLPIVFNLVLTKYDLLAVDESQDLNRCQHELIKRSGKRLILVGDDRQAIMGFAGADCESLPNIIKDLSATEQGCRVLPLTVTRRCAKAIVREAQKIVPDFEAFETNPEGSVRHVSIDGYQKYIRAGDMILCRVNAPLITECFTFLKAGKRAEILGKDIGQGLISTINKVLKGYTWETDIAGICELRLRLREWLHAETSKEFRKKKPNEGRLVGIQDRYTCLSCFIDNEHSVEAVIAKIETLFTDEAGEKAIRLSSIHKSKGLENPRVFLLEPEGSEVPHPMVRTEWGMDQEWNLRYVAQTRAISELVYVS